MRQKSCEGWNDDCIASGKQENELSLVQPTTGVSAIDEVSMHYIELSKVA